MPSVYLQFVLAFLFRCMSFTSIRYVDSLRGITICTKKKQPIA